MADPHIKSPMDGWDYLTVILYRLGFFIATVGIMGLLFATPWGIVCVALAAALCASSLHIYLKKFRLILQFATWTGLILMLLNAHALALGAFFVTLGGLCFKEYFCFRVPLLQFQPLFLAILWLASTIHHAMLTSILGILCTALFLLLAIKKALMPLHFDIGDKQKYEI
ncbi:DUF2301 domain-containing membrane protein [Spirabiliibacterium falconis]|uniref:DUF2301 domain-containing membrane protein n=1 Tax=Spirabiliibacterium falconis TaxID=572023 RepID=UPI001AAD9C45|nr:DUF2301 domain-containing membrane protein [Spirabiliibacterium falconis]MBE2894181.1 hypothetical protein [Spirabiliibacterium falconis]